MVCATNEVEVVFLLLEGIKRFPLKNYSLPVSTTIQKFHEQVSIDRKCDPNSFQLFIEKVPLPKSGTLLDLFPKSQSYSAEIEIDVVDSSTPELENRWQIIIRRVLCDYVGLVNQAMTCYLNSLLQALYMTPEFRNALYNWEYFKNSEKDLESSSIPFQLQKLFLNLQTSTKGAVETTSLTKSFGWDSSEAWQQHDIQELCRVMFDALETKFQNTEQADLINRLYEGKMIDYVKCLECKTEKKREDTFLDIPLPVRPFESTTAYESVEEALTAFVKYETLDGNNQYHCEKCNKKCDAHKGLKFTKFPYILSLHLKRFDFDYKTLYRIKLNDRVTFPHTLNLNSFINTTQNQESPCTEEDAGMSVKFDDTSTTDSGTLEDDYPPSDGAVPTNNHSNNHDQENDEGIDMTNGTSVTNGVSHNHESDKNHAKCSTEEGPYVYELFSIMIHNGSASGGHYYAYIKDFTIDQWLSFNDTNVNPITESHIERVYGGGPTKAYSSSTNAYMLMYRQKDPSKNALPMREQDFPPHIKTLLQNINESEDDNRRYDVRVRTRSPARKRVYCHHPKLQKPLMKTLSYEENTSLLDLKERAYDIFGLHGEVELNQCRLVFYDTINRRIKYSYEGEETDLIKDINQKNERWRDLFLEIREKDQQFETFKLDDIPMQVYVIDMANEDLVDGPFNVRGYNLQTGREFKKQISEVVKIEAQKMNVFIKIDKKYQVFQDDQILNSESFEESLISKVYITTSSDSINEEDNTPSMMLLSLIRQFQRAMLVYFELHPVDKAFLDVAKAFEIPAVQNDVNEKSNKPLNRPTEECVNNETKVHFEKKNSVDSVDGLKQNHKDEDDLQTRVCGYKDEHSKISSSKGEDDSKSTDINEAAGARTKSFEEVVNKLLTKGLPVLESTSEDSSLSDSEKTLVDESSDSHINKSPEIGEIVYQYTKNESAGESNYYFKDFPCYSEVNKKVLKAFVDERMSFEILMKKLKDFVGVEVKTFTIYVQNADSSLGNPTDLKDSLDAYNDGQRFCIKMGRPNSHRNGLRLNLYLLNPSCTEEPFKYMFNWYVLKDMTVAQAKEEIIAELKREHNIEIPFERLRLRKKMFSFPTIVLLNNVKFKDIPILFEDDIVIQELQEDDTITEPEQIALFVRLWSRSTLELHPCQDIVLSRENNVTELFEKIESLSKIPVDCLEIAKGKGNLPCENLSFLNLDEDLNWRMKDNNIRLCNGYVMLYRNSQEPLKQLNAEEKFEFNNKEKLRLNALGIPRYYSQRREKPLKIYLDSK